MHSITKSLYKFTSYFVKQYKWHFFAMACFRMCFILDNLVIPYAFKLLVARLTALEDTKTNVWRQLAAPLLGLLLVIVLIDVSFRLFDYMKIKTIPDFESKIRLWIVSYLKGHSYQFFVEHFSGDLSKRVNDLTNGVSQIMMSIMSSFLPSFCTIIFGVVSFAYIQPIFGMILIIWLLLHTITYVVYAKKCNYYTALHAEKRSQLTGSMVDGFSNILSIKLFARNKQAIEHLLHPQGLEKKAYKKALTVIMWLHFVISGLSILFMGICLIAYIIHYWTLGKLSISEITYIFYAGSNMCNLVWASVSEFPEFFQEIGYCQQALKLVQQAYTVCDKPRASVLRCQGAPTVVFQDVCFSYAQNKPLFVNQNISITAGEKVGLVGLSGSGKSTFVNLILRFFDMDKGMIFIDGQDIASVTQESLRAAIAFIPQDTTLFHTNILENIRYGRKEATDEAVMEAAKQARCHNFVTRLPEGYHTLVGERGAKLSGGQRQRIAIARAILKDAPILILDEATSALDAITEQEIQETLVINMKEKTTFVIAHRLAVLRTMDRILVFENGKIVAQGTHDLLLKISPLYASMYRLQSGETGA